MQASYTLSSPSVRASEYNLFWNVDLKVVYSYPRFELSQIGWWLLEVYFGLDASGFESARKSTPLSLYSADYQISCIPFLARYLSLPTPCFPIRCY